jgi:hypothetical protein
MNKQNQGMCLSKYMKNWEKNRFSRILLIFFLYDKNVIFTMITTTLLRLRLGSHKDLYSR